MSSTSNVINNIINNVIDTDKMKQISAAPAKTATSSTSERRDEVRSLCGAGDREATK